MRAQRSIASTWEAGSFSVLVVYVTHNMATSREYQIGDETSCDPVEVGCLAPNQLLSTTIYDFKHSFSGLLLSRFDMRWKSRPVATYLSTAAAMCLGHQNLQNRFRRGSMSEPVPSAFTRTARLTTDFTLETAGLTISLAALIPHSYPLT